MHPDDREVAKAPRSYFGGFDGNNEAQHLGFVKFLFKKKDLFNEQRRYAKKTDGYNSHMPTVETYQRMLTKFRSFGENVTLSREQVLAILAESNHPENRRTPGE